MIGRMPVQFVSLWWIVVIVKNYFFSHTGAVEAVVHYIIKFNQFCQNIQSRAKRIPTLFVHWKVQNVSLYHFFTGQNILGLRGRWVYSSNWHISISIETLSWSRSLHFSSAFCQILHSIDSKNCHSSYILVLLTIIVTTTIIITFKIMIKLTGTKRPWLTCDNYSRWRIYSWHATLQKTANMIIAVKLVIMMIMMTIMMIRVIMMIMMTI